jgi:hypothetical protein
MKIISASRRTDIPAFHMPWFMMQIEAGYCQYPNPFNQKITRVSLRPEDVHSIVFWSKNYTPFLPFVQTLKNKGYCFCAHYTITGLPKLFEPHVPELTDSVKTFHSLSRLLSPEQVFWRFDPIILNPDLKTEAVLDRLQNISELLKGATRQCNVSFVQPYLKVERRFKKQGIRWPDYDNSIQCQMIEDMADILSQQGMQLKVCSQDHLITDQQMKACCIDGEYLTGLFPGKPIITKKSPSRKHCGCSESKDIGTYGTCRHGCLYCYAS